MTTTAERMALRGERAPFVMLPRWLLYHPEVNEGAKFLYCVLHDLVAGREGPTRPVTRAELAAACGVSVDTVDRRLAQLVAARAVEKQARVAAGGQTANVYQVWLTPPDGQHRQPPTPPPDGDDPHHPSLDGEPDDRSRVSAAPVEGCANGQVSRSRDSAAPPQGCGTPGRDSAAPSVLEESQERPPQPPRGAGGPDASQNQHQNEQDLCGLTARRASGTNPRSLGANPRAEADRIEQTREREAADRREAELAAAAEARRAAEAEADAAARAFEAEADALSAVLDDDRLAAIMARVGEELAGPLARSPFAMARAVVVWCRGAAERHPGPLDGAVDAAIAAGWRPGPDAHPAPLRLPSAPAGTPPLRPRLASRVRVGPPTEAPR